MSSVVRIHCQSPETLLCRSRKHTGMNVPILQAFLKERNFHSLQPHSTRPFLQCSAGLESVRAEASSKTERLGNKQARNADEWGSPAHRIQHDNAPDSKQYR